MLAWIGRLWLVMALLLPGSLLPQQAIVPVQLPGTVLRVQLPSGWRLDPPRQPPQQHLLITTTEPRYELWVSQTLKTGGPSCMSLIGSMQAVPGLATSIQPRPAFIPDVYMGSILTMADVQLVCLSTGDYQIGVMIQARGGNARPGVLRPMLAAIADAALKQSSAVSSPGRLKLPLLGIEIPLREGAWGVRETTDFWGRNDVLGRVAKPGSNEVNITPLVFGVPGRCENLGSTSPSAIRAATFVPERRYGGDRWYRGAWEQFPPPFKALVAYVCRNVGPNSILIARIEYEKNAMPEADVAVIRQILDDIGDAADARRVPPSQPAAGATLGAGGQASALDVPQILSDPQGYNFGPYINVLIGSIRLNWFAMMPDAAIQGAQGYVGTVFTITRDGRVSDIELAPASGTPALDRGATAAIQASAPFPALPAEFKGDRLRLRLNFLYNVPPAQRD